MFITAYMVLREPRLYKVPVHEVIESLYDHVDAFAILDVSANENFDPSKYGKIRKYVKGLINPFDNPLGSLYTTAYKLVESDHALFLEGYEIFEFKDNKNLKDIVNSKGLDLGVGKAVFYSQNYVGHRSIVVEGPRECALFKTDSKYIHDFPTNSWEHNEFKRVNILANQRGTDIVNRETGESLDHYSTLSQQEVMIHNVEGLDCVAYTVREFWRANYRGTVDLFKYYGSNNTLTLEEVEQLFEVYTEAIKNGNCKPIPWWGEYLESIDYKSNVLVDRYINDHSVEEILLIEKED